MAHGEETTGHDSFIQATDFIPLIWSAMRQSHVNSAELSRRTGMTKTKISRTLSGKSPIDLTVIQRMFLALGIDPQRALLAVGQFGDWNQYYDPTIVLCAGLLQHLPKTLAEARKECTGAELADSAIKTLSNHVAALISRNDRKVRESREAFLIDGDLRRVV